MKTFVQQHRINNALENEGFGRREEFLSCVDACIEAIRRMPDIHAIIYEDFHRGLVRRFPY